MNLQTSSEEWQKTQKETSEFEEEKFSQKSQISMEASSLSRTMNNESEECEIEGEGDHSIITKSSRILEEKDKCLTKKEVFQNVSESGSFTFRGDENQEKLDQELSNDESNIENQRQEGIEKKEKIREGDIPDESQIGKREGISKITQVDLQNNATYHYYGQLEPSYTHEQAEEKIEIEKNYVDFASEFYDNAEDKCNKAEISMRNKAENLKDDIESYNESLEGLVLAGEMKYDTYKSSLDAQWGSEKLELIKKGEKRVDVVKRSINPIERKSQSTAEEGKRRDDELTKLKNLLEESERENKEIKRQLEDVTEELTEKVKELIETYEKLKKANQKLKIMDEKLAKANEQIRKEEEDHNETKQKLLEEKLEHAKSINFLQKLANKSTTEISHK